MMRPKIDLKRYRRKPEEITNPYPDSHLDRIHSLEAVFYCDEIAGYLYAKHTPVRVRYHYKKRQRPLLDEIVETASINARNREEMAIEITRWINNNLIHTAIRQRLHPHKKPLLGGTEEAVIERGYGYCNEMSRVFVTACQMAGVPARLIFVARAPGRGHVLSEAYVSRRWAMFDMSLRGFVRAPDGHIYSAEEIHRSKRVRARVDRVLEREWRVHHPVKEDPNPYSAFFNAFGVCNYPLADSFKHFRKHDKTKARAQISV